MRKQTFKQSLMVVLVLLLSITLLVGCSSDDESEDSEPTEVEILEEQEEIINGLGIATADVLEIVAEIESFDGEETFEVDGVTINTFISEDNAIRLLSYYLEGDESISTLIFRVEEGNDANHVRANELMEMVLQFLREEHLPEDVYGPLLRGNQTRDNYRLFLITSPHEHNWEDLPWTAEEIGFYEPAGPTNILNDEELLTDLLTNAVELEFNEIVEMVDAYLESSEDISEDDVAHEIRELAVRGSELVETVELVVDDFDGQVTVYYPGVREITSEINIVPYIRPAGVRNGRANADFYLTMGFYRDGWLFFDRTELRMVEDFIFWRNYKSFDTNRDVISGGTIRETITLDWSLINAGSGYMSRLEEQMDVDYDHVLRFVNTDEDNNFDVTLSDVEVTAVATLAEIFNIMGRLTKDIPDEFAP